MNSMSNKLIIKYALANSLWTVLYVILIGVLFSNAQAIFGDVKSALIPIAMLLLFVFSALLCGSLILGRPILWYLDGRKNEALKLFSYTVVSLFVVLVLIFVVLYAVSVY